MAAVKHKPLYDARHGSCESGWVFSNNATATTQQQQQQKQQQQADTTETQHNSTTEASARLYA
jgi:hypothetical protein